VQRRFTVRGEAAGVLVVDDYGHHPVEIEATLQAAEEAFPDRRLIAVVQPHRYSRVKDLWNTFCGAFYRANVVVVCPIYPAGESPIPGIDHERLAHELRARGHRRVSTAASLQGATDWLRGQVRAGDLVLTLGAGNVHTVCTDLLDALRAKATPS
jgi:UDP-N-acetylmuramate--alanine ligase